VTTLPTANPALPRADLEPLLVPISAERAGGESLRFDPVYDEIKRLREEDDPSLPQGIWQRELKRADWAGVAELCAGALATRTKDLQIAAWLTEAWVHLYGFAGLGLGLRLLAGFCRDFWEDLHPSAAEEGAEARLAPILWAVDKLVLPVKRIPVSAPAGGESEAYGWQDWESGLYLANLSKVNAPAAAAAQERGMVTQSKFLVSISLTAAPWFGALSGELDGSLAALEELEQVLLERCGEAAAPSLTPLRSPVVAIQAFVSRLLEERVEKGELPGVEPQEAATPGSEGAPEERTSTATHIAGRADAYRKLREASDYLLRTEPHSPVPYLVRRAVSWGNMSLAELLEELLQKNADLATLYTLLGIKRSS
jgi:type VI secretion system protein ImpA